MRKIQFNNNLEIVENSLGITKDVMFEKTKNRDVVEARDLLYYLCTIQKMRANTILKFCQELGFEADLSQISRGKAKVKHKISTDEIWKELIKGI
mgnify:CR=1 FL=1